MSNFRNPDAYNYTEPAVKADSIEGLTARVMNLEENGVGGQPDYENIKNKPTINGKPIEGNMSGADLDLSYNDLNDKPKINSVELEGDKSQSDLHISGGAAPSVVGENLIFV